MAKIAPNCLRRKIRFWLWGIVIRDFRSAKFDDDFTIILRFGWLDRWE
jgi:hypothetical protein